MAWKLRGMYLENSGVCTLETRGYVCTLESQGYVPWKLRGNVPWKERVCALETQGYVPWKLGDMCLGNLYLAPTLLKLASTLLTLFSHLLSIINIIPQNHLKCLLSL